MKDWQIAVLEEVRLEMERDDPFSKRVKYVEFRSHSNGRGRCRRRWPRDVALLVVDQAAFQVIRSEIKPRRKRGPTPAIDSLAAEILTDLPWDKRTIDAFLARAITKARTKAKTK